MRRPAGLILDCGHVLTLPQDPDVDDGRGPPRGRRCPAFREAYWRHRLAYDAELSALAYWRRVLADARPGGPALDDPPLAHRGRRRVLDDLPRAGVGARSRLPGRGRRRHLPALPPAPRAARGRRVLRGRPRRQYRGRRAGDLRTVHFDGPGAGAAARRDRVADAGVGAVPGWEIAFWPWEGHFRRNLCGQDVSG